MVQPRLMHSGIHLSSIRQINSLSRATKHSLYCSLVPLSILNEPCTTTLNAPQAPDALSIRLNCPENTGFVEIDIRHPYDRRDPLLYVHLADTPSAQLEVLLMRVNDPYGPRFEIDQDWQGEPTKLGTAARNIPAEIAAIKAGLAPGQVRKGLRLCGDLIPIMERFAASLGKSRFFIEPLAYHNAILFERYGFAYLRGRIAMEWIHNEFGPEGDLYAKLDGSTPFRMPGAEKTIRGRSWAIHDGILGANWANVRMYKRVDYHAGLCTFPDAVY
jgi:hypothetical protein